MSIKLLIRLVLVIPVMFVLASTGFADMARDDLPPDVQWYAHADFKEMEGSVTGKYILDFLDKEVFSELRDETGIDLRKDLEAALVFGGHSKRDGAVVVYGKISDRNRTKINALMELYGEYEREMRKGTEVFSLNKRSTSDDDDDSGDMFVESRTTYVAFGKRNQTMITQNRGQLDAFVEAGGQVRQGRKAPQAGSLLVLQADRSLVKAGMNAGAGIADGGDWNSNVLQHMERIALVLADQSGNAAIDVELVTNKPELAESIKNILQGLISIKALDQDEDPEVLALLRNIRLELAGASIRASMVVDPERLREMVR